MRKKSVVVLVLAIVFVLLIGATAAFATMQNKPTPKVFAPQPVQQILRAGRTFKVLAELNPNPSTNTTLTAAIVVLKWDGTKYSQIATAPASFEDRMQGKFRRIGAKLTLIDADFYKIKSVLLRSGAVVSSSRFVPIAVWPLEPTSTPAPTPAP
jgi:hypothetical protein